MASNEVVIGEATKALKDLIFIVLGEYAADDDRYILAVKIAEKFGIDISDA